MGPTMRIRADPDTDSLIQVTKIYENDKAKSNY